MLHLNCPTSQWLSGTNSEFLLVTSYMVGYGRHWVDHPFSVELFCSSLICGLFSHFLTLLLEDLFIPDIWTIWDWAYLFRFVYVIRGRFDRVRTIYVSQRQPCDPWEKRVFWNCKCMKNVSFLVPGGCARFCWWNIFQNYAVLIDFHWLG